jgi:hypothetical protein
MPTAAYPFSSKTSPAAFATTAVKKFLRFFAFTFTFSIRRRVSTSVPASAEADEPYHKCKFLQKINTLSEEVFQVAKAYTAFSKIFNPQRSRTMPDFLGSCLELQTTICGRALIVSLDSGPVHQLKISVNTSCH